MFFHIRYLFRVAAFICASAATAVSAQSDANDAQALLHALDYLAVDYPHVVHNGVVVDASEYAEQREFAQRAVELIDKLPPQPAKATLVNAAHGLENAISQRAAGHEVQAQSRALADDVIRVYQVKVSPHSVPPMADAAGLYQANCAVCHGAQGHGDGPRAAALEPKPINFHDAARQNQRSVYSLYSTITLGIDGTAMTPFTQLSEAERWALAFYVSNFIANDAERQHGEQLWQQGSYRHVFSNLTQLTQAMPSAIGDKHGKDAVEVLAYLRAQPQQINTGRPSPLDVARQKLKESVAAYRAGDNAHAYDLAVGAYLEGYELAEKALANIDAERKIAVETAMMQYRQAIKQSAPIADVEARAAALQVMVSDAAHTLSDTEHASPLMNFASSLVILLREGVEAFLVLAAIVAFLIKTERRDALIYVHLGWLGAIAAGIATWIAAKSLLSFTSADREVVEGTVALIAAAMLLYVGYWLHSHSYAQRWQTFVRSHIHHNLADGTVWGLSLVSFIAVYREVAETILFYEALWLQAGEAGHNALIGGVIAATLLLLLIAWLMFRLSIRLPLQIFFRVNAALLVTLAVIFAGKGVAALQEAGKLSANPINFPRVDLLGIHPSAEGVGLQLMLIVMALGWLAYGRMRPSKR